MLNYCPKIQAKKDMKNSQNLKSNPQIYLIPKKTFCRVSSREASRRLPQRNCAEMWESDKWVRFCLHHGPMRNLCLQRWSFTHFLWKLCARWPMPKRPRIVCMPKWCTGHPMFVALLIYAFNKKALKTYSTRNWSHLPFLRPP